MHGQTPVDEYLSIYSFQPVYSMAGRLLALEMFSRFNSPNGNLAMPAGIGFNLLSEEQKIELFNEQLILAEHYADWFVEYDVLLTINIEETVVDFLLNDHFLRQRIQRLLFIVFAVGEISPNLSAGKNNEKLNRLSREFTLWLNNLGSGNSTLTALYDGLFDYVKIDKRFY
jgi:EAL domain-containing protein (putative c-di-GMP-specific phosphodiesterase class I)